MLKLKTCFLFQVAANHGNEKPKQVPKSWFIQNFVQYNLYIHCLYRNCTQLSKDRIDS